MAGSLGFASRLGGRGSVTAEQAAAQMYSNGIVSGFVVSPATPTANMTVTVGGVAGTPDVMVATNAVGNNVFLKNRNTDAFTLAMTAPASNSVIYSVVGFTDDLSVATSDATSVADNPSECGLIAVAGTSAASPVAPSDAQIRTAITSAGFTGSQAAYGVLGYVTLASTTTTITAPNISQVGRTTPLSVAKINGGTTAGVLTTDASGGVTGANVRSSTNTGTAGGTMYYIDLGGIKLLWMRTGTWTIGANGDTTKTITLPSGFFSSIIMVQASTDGRAAVAYDTWVNTVVRNSSTTTVSIAQHNFGSGTSGSVGSMVFVIGT